jgi:hypothetical protein
MFRHQIIFLFLICSITALAQQAKYSEVRIYIHREGLVQLASLGIAADEGYFDNTGFLITVLSNQELDLLRREGFHFDILHENYPEYIHQRNTELLDDIRRINQTKNDYLLSEITAYPVPVHFELGSMGGFYTLQEVLQELDSMHLLYPDLVKAKATAGNSNSIENRPVYYVKISDNPNIQEQEPRVFYNALTHAREPMGMQLLIYFMWYLLENYETSEEIQYLVNNLELYFIPVVNPDGYEYNHINNPVGGGMWRKNRRNNGDGTFGVDLNRNFGYMWGYDNTGSSPIPGDETYRGTGPFSEPETQIIRDFCNEREFKQSLNYHTYSNLLLYPWSYITQMTPDSLIELNFADILTRENQYTSGVPGAILYNTNGDANDWMYGEQTTKPVIYPFTPEAGNDADGFWPVPSRIIPLAQENMYQNLMLAHLTLKYAETRDMSPVIMEDRQGYFKFEFTRYGLMFPGNYEVSIEPLDTAQIILVGPPQLFINPVKFFPYSDSISYNLASNLEIGTEFKFLYKISNGLYTFRDTITKYFGPPVVIFSDNCNSMAQWNSNKWDVTNAQYHSPTGSITDSPGGNYSSNSNYSVTMNNSYPVGSSPVAVVEFWAKWRIEKGYDYVQIKASDDNSFIWTPLAGYYTHPGTNNQAPGEPVYDGFKNNWVKEQIVLHDYTGKNLKLRFTIRSDMFTNYDGYYFDDMTITVIDMTGVGLQNQVSKTAVLSAPVPNPAGDRATFQYRLKDHTGGVFIMTDSHGKKNLELPITGEEGFLEVLVQDYLPGIYVCRIHYSGGTSETQKLIIIR